MHLQDSSPSAEHGVAREAAIALLAFSLLALAYLARPIALHRTHTFASVDAVTQGWSATRDPGYEGRPHEVLRDPVVQFLPWAELNAAELGAGRWPLWNPANGAGVPHLANYQSAVLSPFTLPFYAFGSKAGLIVSAFAKLVCCGLFTYLFLRELALARGAAAFGACAFAFAGFPLLWIQYPHTSVIAALPAALFFAERALRGLESGADGTSGGRSGTLPPGACAGLVLSLAAAVLAGHPETLFFCALVVLAWCASRLASIAWRRRTAASSRAPVWRAAAIFVGLALLATGLGACQLLPFFEYLAHSAALDAERHAGRALRAQQWPVLLFPNLAGTPADGSSFAYNLPGPNYQEFNAFHVAGSVLALALLGLPLWWRDARARCFAALVLLWTVYAWDPFGLAAWLTEHTPLGRILVLRTHPLWLLPICALGAFGVDRLSKSRSRRRWASAVVAAGVLALVSFRAGAAAFFRYAAHEVELDPSHMPDGVARHIALTTLAFSGGMLGAALVAFSRAAWPARLGWSALVVGALAESALPFLDYVPSVPDRMSYPRTSAVRELLERTRGEPVLFFTADAPVADSNLEFGLPLVASYDALEIAGQERLRREMFGDGRRTLFARRKGLELYGVRYVLARGGWLAIDTAMGEVLQKKSGTTPYLLPEVQPGRPPAALEPLLPGSELALRFEGARDGLDGACLWFLDDRQALERRVLVTLRELASGATIARREVALGELCALVGARRELVLEFEPLARSGGARFELEVGAPESGPNDEPSDKPNDEPKDQNGAPIRLLAGRAGRAPAAAPATGAPSDGPAVSRETSLAVGGELFLDGRRIEDGLALDLAYGRSHFRHVARVGEQELFEYTRSSGRAWLVEEVRSAALHEEAWSQVLAADFDPRTSVVLEGAVLEGEPALDASPQDAAPAEVTSEARTNSRWTLRTRSGRDSHLVLAQAWFPGWRARVDGADRPLLRANYAFSAVALPAGEHEVVLEYRPVAFRIGLWTSIACAIAGASSWFAASRRSRLG